MTTRSTPAAVAVSFVASLLIGVSVSSSASAQVVSAYGAPNPGAPQELSEFAFLIGKWHAQGRTLQDDGTWKEPVMVWTFRYILDGYAIAGVFEEQGEDGELTSAGMDFRFYNRDQDRWTIEYFVPRVSFLMSQAQEDVGGVQASDTSVTVVRPLTSPPACSETICRGAGCGRTRMSGSVGGWGQQRPWSTRPFISAAQIKPRQSAAIAHSVERLGDGMWEVFPTMLKNATLNGRGNTREQLSQRGASILETYRVAGTQRIKGDPVIEPFHAATFEDAQRLQWRSSAQQEITQG